ncbi:hypothetical protein NDU88_002975 [Pleurodeles waltl]|uniref:Lamina-associated polypeptide 2 alpha C-terminal domain-containing protein n=1 Tax=Pleurodeles waltl TaxID=8319 RepID=A0AAV7W3E0_PLEWA|nr:hypothetical protein NDU88_002975 [Pleurodeles waltl]
MQKLLAARYFSREDVWAVEPWDGGGSPEVHYKRHFAGDRDRCRRKAPQLAASPSSSSGDEGPAPEELTGKYIAKDQVLGLVHHVKVTMGFQDEDSLETSSSALLRQFQSSTPVDVPVHACIKEVVQWEWRDPEKFLLLLLFMAKVYPLHDMQPDLPDSIPLDYFVSSLVGCTSLAEDAVLKDPIDKKVYGSLKKVYSGAHLTLPAGIYGTYVAQSLIYDCSSILELIERQVEFLLDISFDVIRASALAGGACVTARRALVLRDWKTHAAQKAYVLTLPFQGSLLFGPELESLPHKLFKEKKHSSSIKSGQGDRLFRCKSPMHQPPLQQSLR